MLMVSQDLSRLIIGIQLVKVGYELPKQYQKQRAMEMTICLFPVMAMMWLCTTGCIKLIVPKISVVCISFLENFLEKILSAD
jgi:NhaP-type Na+/H+ or K+/H+ antiporter